LRAVSPQARRRTVQEHVRAELAKILGADPGIAIAPDVPLQELGFDSLMAVELRNVLAKSLGLALPPTLALDYPTLDALGAQLLARFFPGEAGEDAAPDDAAAIAALSEEDAEAMLLQELEALSA
jgi:pimaricinolide synthase PimS1